VVWLRVLESAQANAFPEEASSALPDVAVAVAGAPVVVLSVEVVALAPEPVTVPLPLAIIGAVTVVPATEAPLVWFADVVIDTLPLPAFAVLLVEGVTVCMIAPVGPASSHSLLHHRLESAMVRVSPPVAVLSASGLTWMVVLPVRLLLEEDGLTVIELFETLPDPEARGLDQTEALPPWVQLDVLEKAFAVALPLEASSALPVVALDVAAAPVVRDVVIVLALAADPLTLAVPLAVIPALTVVSPVDAALVCELLVPMVVAPLPAVAELLTEGVTVWVIAPVLPSHSDSMKQRRLESAEVPVKFPDAWLLADGLTLMRVRPVLFQLLERGLTSSIFPSIVPSPHADGLECTVALPPRVLLHVDDFALARAAPLLPSSALPVVAVAVAGPPVVVELVLVVAEAPEFNTEAVPVAVDGAVTFVAPTVAVLPCVVVELMLTAPPPAEAELFTEGVTVWLIAPVLPSPALPEAAAVPVLVGAVESKQPLLPDDPLLADVQVGPPRAVLDALGETLMLVFPVLLLLDALGETVMELPLTLPDPLAEGLLVTVALPPDVVLVVVDVECEVAFPLPPDPDFAVDVAAAPEVVPVVVVVAELPPSAKAGAATRMTTRPAVTKPVIADARDARKKCLKVDVSSEFILSPLLKGALHGTSTVHARKRVNLSSSASTSCTESPPATPQRAAVSLLITVPSIKHKHRTDI
jgi:hypothetical protein